MIERTHFGNGWDRLPADPTERARYYRQKASEYRERAKQSVLDTVRESYLLMAQTSDTMAAAAENNGTSPISSPTQPD